MTEPVIIKLSLPADLAGLIPEVGSLRIEGMPKQPEGVPNLQALSIKRYEEAVAIHGRKFSPETGIPLMGNKIADDVIAEIFERVVEAVVEAMRQA